MVTRTSQDWHGCPIRYGAVIFGDVWSLLILRDIVFKGARHYADFLNADEGISTNILAARLARLEAEGVLSKAQDGQNKTRFVYSLTEKGKSLVPTLLEIMDWSETWDQQTEVPEEFINELRQDKAVLAAKIVSGL